MCVVVVVVIVMGIPHDDNSSYGVSRKASS